MAADDLEIRIGDAEREKAAALLGQHYAMGRLTMIELENRLESIYSGRTRTQVDNVLADLPSEPQLLDAPALWFKPTRHTQWTRWALTGAICLLVWVITSLAQGRPLEFWPVWVIGPWGVMLLIHRWAPTDAHPAHEDARNNKPSR